MAPRTRIDRQTEHDRDLIVTLTYERDQAIACLTRIARMRRARNMREKAKECLRGINGGTS